MTVITEHPILFTAEMVRAILEGRKTQTRRIIKCNSNTGHNGMLLGEWGLSRPPFKWRGDADDVNWHWRGQKPSVGDWIEQYQTDVDDHASRLVKCPYGKPGDSLWVKEPVYWSPENDNFYYAADKAGCGTRFYQEKKGCHPNGLRSIFLPRYASRIKLPVTAIRVERVQDISADDAEAEGVPLCEQCGGNGWINSGPNGGYECEAPGCGDCIIEQYSRLWEKINGNPCRRCKGQGVVTAWSGSASGNSVAIDSKECPECQGNPPAGSWAANPWVWVIEFPQYKRGAA